ncbi:MAG: nucleotide exchange factor GrpE [Rhodanobacteraceae bacterium]|jgi:molecular chaperone GrpE|nr:nucleotide exchange factor GrpE [Rhodanobacteraceae bacterium]
MHASPEQERPETTSDAEGFGPQETIETLRQRIAELEAEQLRERAEAENQRKRWLREFEQARKFGVERLLNDLLPVIDSLEQGIKAADAPAAGIDSLKQGSEMTLRLLQKAADGHGLSVVDPLGQPFNPDQHQAIGMQPSAEVPADHVMLVMQKGYRLHDRLVRPALVMVSQG